MAIEQGLFQLLQSNATIGTLINTAQGKGVYWILIPKGATVPALVITKIATDDTVSTSKTFLTRGALFQIDCYGTSYYQSKNVATAVRGVLNNYTGTLTEGTVVQGITIEKDWDMPFEESSALGFVYRNMLQFRVWYLD